MKGSPLDAAKLLLNGRVVGAGWTKGLGEALPAPTEIVVGGNGLIGEDASGLVAGKRADPTVDVEGSVVE